MLKLHEIQQGVRLAILGEARPEIVMAILGEGREAEARLRIHRHNVLASLTEALKANFSVVCSVVHERFFAYAANAFIHSHPPASPCLCECGAAFADFLRGFAPVRHLRYLYDLARLEWADDVARSGRPRRRQRFLQHVSPPPVATARARRSASSRPT